MKKNFDFKKCIKQRNKVKKQAHLYRVTALVALGLSLGGAVQSAKATELVQEEAATVEKVDAVSESDNASQGMENSMTTEEAVTDKIASDAVDVNSSENFLTIEEATQSENSQTGNSGTDATISEGAVDESSPPEVAQVELDLTEFESIKGRLNEKISSGEYVLEDIQRAKDAISLTENEIANGTEAGPLTQDELNLHVKTLVQIYYDIVNLNTDKFFLQYAIERARGYNRYDWTYSSWEVMISYYQQAKKVYENPVATQAEVDQACDELMISPNSLIPIWGMGDSGEFVGWVADYQLKIAEMYGLDLANNSFEVLFDQYFTEESRAAFFAALEKARLTINSYADRTDIYGRVTPNFNQTVAELQAEIDGYFNTLLQAANDLTLTETPPEIPTEEIEVVLDSTERNEIVQRIIDRINGKNYSDESNTQAAEFIDFVDELIKNGTISGQLTQTELNEYVHQLVDTFYNKFVVDKSKLLEVLLVAEGLIASDWTSESWAAMLPFWGMAQDVYDNPEVFQPAINQATDELWAAIRALVPAQGENPEPIPEPTPEPNPEPTPEPTPEPEPNPEPTPEPTPEPNPDPSENDNENNSHEDDSTEGTLLNENNSKEENSNQLSNKENSSTEKASSNQTHRPVSLTTSANTSAKQLPQTGETSNNSVRLLGLGAVASVAVLGVAKRKEKNKKS